VQVKEYGTVITTHNLLHAGFVDLSLCPLQQSLVGCVISRGITYHDNVSTHRSVCQHQTKLLVYIPVPLHSFNLVSVLACFEAVTVACRTGVPVDIAQIVKLHGIKSAVCAPIKLAAVMSEGNIVGSERVVGCLTLGSSEPNGVTAQ